MAFTARKQNNLIETTRQSYNWKCKINQFNKIYYFISQGDDFFWNSVITVNVHIEMIRGMEKLKYVEDASPTITILFINKLLLLDTKVTYKYTYKVQQCV
jgi:hypothetical protein